MNEQDYKEAIEKLSNLHQKEVGELLRAIQNKAAGKDSTERKLKQKNLDQFALGMVVVYLFAIFEDYFPWTEVKEKHVFLEKYKAYRHIRHSYAHKPTGQRANMHRAEFETLYLQPEFRNLVSWDEKSDTIEVSVAFVTELSDFLSNSVAIMYNNR